MINEKRRIKLAVISDVHLGTYGCHAKELFYYLKSIQPEILVLNGDIIDMWQFKKSYWPSDHMKVIKQLTSILSRDTKVYYIAGNHDEMLRNFVGFEMGPLKIVNKIVLELDGKQAWLFHGDIFDVTMQHSKWLTKLGSSGYDILIWINRFVNRLLEDMGREKISLSKKIKDGVKRAVSHINNFERTAADIGISNGYEYVVCGHIHKPEIKNIQTDKGDIQYLNSGDWVENLTALEYDNGRWSIYKFHEDKLARSIMEGDSLEAELDSKAIFEELIKEFKIIPS